MRKLLMVLCFVFVSARQCEAQVPPDFGAVFAIAYTDLFGRDATGTITLMSEVASLEIEFVDDTGTTSYSNSFPLLVETGESPEIVQFQDFDGLLGGSVDLVGVGLLSTEIVRGTIPVIEAGEVIVWNLSTGFQSAGNTGPATTQVVNVPEPATDLLVSAIMASVGFFMMRRN